ncbi:hypothetical protein ACIQI7_04675 [Kitasatospora sp. NPDC092039]|uniref:effector-associated constant component EACC1 n=1 Tax=Kitasatospora sp. NPDC092039 TaxID=3364086 RepID=UPI0038050459
MATFQETHHRIEFLDSDLLRARREARELAALLATAKSEATLRLPTAQPTGGTDKGADVTALVGLLISGGSLAVSLVQTWLARVPHRTISVTRRSDGATLTISGRQAREDAALLEAFLSEGSGAPEEPDGSAESEG